MVVVAVVEVVVSFGGGEAKATAAVCEMLVTVLAVRLEVVVYFVGLG